jgi:hypothetical protein
VRIGVIIAQRYLHFLAGPANTVFQGRLLGGGCSVFGEEVLASDLCIGWTAEVEERATGHLRVVEHPVKNLKLGDAPTFEFAQPRLLFLKICGEGLWPGVQPYRSPSKPMKKGRQALISSRQSFRVSLRVACSSAMPQRMSSSTNST